MFSLPHSHYITYFMYRIISYHKNKNNTFVFYRIKSNEERVEEKKKRIQNIVTKKTTPKINTLAFAMCYIEIFL